MKAFQFHDAEKGPKELSGSLGLAGSLNAGADHAAAQAQHGSAPDLAGKDKANPTSMILSAAMLQRWHGERAGDPRHIDAARLIDETIDRVISDVATRTADLGGSLGTKQFTETVVAALG